MIPGLRWLKAIITKPHIEAIPGSYWTVPVSAFHDCDKEHTMLKHLHLAVDPPETMNDGKPFWFMVLNTHNGYLEFPVKYCPLCGERLLDVIALREKA